MSKNNPDRFILNHALLAQSHAVLQRRDKLYWIVGGAGSGKTTICQVLSARLGIPVYDMDAHIYGTYHDRFTQERHPINTMWSKSDNGLAWLLAMSWEEFNHFNQAALPEYLDLLAEDLGASDLNASVLIDGGICNPGLMTQAIPPRQIVCLARPGRSSAEIWSENDERNSMKAIIHQLPKPEQAWLKFLEFDKRITLTILKECQEYHIPVCSKSEMEPLDGFADRVAQVLGIPKDLKQPG